MSILLHPDIEPGQLGELGSRVAAVECLRSATEQKAGLEALVDELCRRLNNHLHPESEEGAVAAAPRRKHLTIGLQGNLHSCTTLPFRPLRTVPRCRRSGFLGMAATS
ncbi:hypothetical protein MRX96_041540 [Rhipicephalus microplus]